MDLYVERLKKPKGVKDATGGAGVKINTKIRVQIWELHIGVGVKRATCPLCGLCELHGPAQNSGFQACHVVATKFSPASTNTEYESSINGNASGTGKIFSGNAAVAASAAASVAANADVFYLFPGCQTCNNECAEQCLLDFLYTRLRYKQLRAFIWSIFCAYTTIHENELAQHEGLCWRVLDHLYGKKRFPAGGGIENTWAIYQMANAEQMKHLNEEIGKLSAQLSHRITLLNALSNTEIKPMFLM